MATVLAKMRRKLQPEILDSLAPDNPEARRSRRDLRVVNRIMGNFRWFARVLPGLGGGQVLEIGAGTGELGLHLARRGIAIDGLDRQPRPASWPAARAWHHADLRSFGGYANYDTVIANLVLHHLTEAELAEFGRRLDGRVRLILASEPARRRRWEVIFGLLSPAFGASRVTRHDARASIGAGFLGAELPAALGLDGGRWIVRCAESAAGAYRLVAAMRP